MPRLAVARPATAVLQVAELTAIAHAADDEPAFRAEMNLPVRVSDDLRARLRHVDALVATAAPRAGPAAATLDARVLTWRLLWALKIRVLRLEGGDAADRTAAVASLRGHTPDGTAAQADDLFARLVDLAGHYASTGAKVTRDQLVADAAIPPVEPAARGRLSADAMLRGPIDHLGMTQQLADADALYDSDPAAAAAGYAVVADALHPRPTPRMRPASGPGRPRPPARPATTPAR